ncbi:MAG: hypothetical protein CVU05_03130 [Bacteroidetes bacterium HGW-Bacteroidetes-21]|jgi:chemotaxis protein CheY-P-specific phosphatase CheC|nr:MAG: hypothetical protein CVU05_03130 [Bacteroidetes bacterium HGW-Bacteroidetes-21]
MATELDQVDLDFTKEVINIGFAKSADSLSYFLNEKVYIQPYDMKFNSDNYFPLSKKNSINNSYLLTTHIKGAFEGKAYLIFSEKEVEKLLTANFSQSILSKSPEEKSGIINDFLLEIDNIISASVITQFANLLKYSIHGDVPKLDIVPSSELNEFLRKSNPGELKIFYLNSKFVTKNVDISPEFIWLLDDRFFNQVNQILGSKQKSELYAKLTSNS